MTENDHIFMPENHMDELYNSPNHVVRFVHNDRQEKIINMLPINGKYKILDAGCGEGHLLEKMHNKFPYYHYYGSDITDVALASAKERCSFAIIQKMDLKKLEYENEFFDVIICTEVLEHIYEYETVINELIRVLKKDGILIVSFPNELLWTLSRFILKRRPIKVPDHVNSFTPSLLRSKIKILQINQISFPFSFLPFSLSSGCIMKFKK